VWWCGGVVVWFSTIVLAIVSLDKVTLVWTLSHHVCKTTIFI
jgi:hypothetical protein